MTTIEQIEALAKKVIDALTYEESGRQIIADSCKELYRLIEEDVYNAGAEWMLKGLYNDLCNGNFAEPYMCELKKNTFLTCKKIYEDRIVPNL